MAKISDSADVPAHAYHLVHTDIALSIDTFHQCCTASTIVYLRPGVKFSSVAEKRTICVLHVVLYFSIINHFNDQIFNFFSFLFFLSFFFVFLPFPPPFILFCYNIRSPVLLSTHQHISLILEIAS